MKTQRLTILRRAVAIAATAALSLGLFAGQAFAANSGSSPNYGGDNGDGTFTNPVTFSDVPDPDVIYDGQAYYMVSTTDHMAPGVPILKSTDLVNWKLVNYASPVLSNTDALALRNG